MAREGVSLLEVAAKLQLGLSGSVSARLVKFNIKVEQS
jgi:hypothetical protein